MRPLPFLIVLFLSVVPVAGCGGSEPKTSGRTPFQESLATLCDSTRVDLEKVGEARDVGLDVWAPETVRIGRGFVKDMKKLQVPAYAEAQAKELARLFDLYYEGQHYAYGFAKAGNRETFTAAENEALFYLRQAETLSTKMGVPECARRPFDPPPES